MLLGDIGHQVGQGPGGQRPQLLSVNPDAAAAGGELAQQQAEQGGLAAAVGTGQKDDLPSAGLKADAPHHVAAAVAPPQVPDLQKHILTVPPS